MKKEKGQQGGRVFSRSDITDHDLFKTQTENGRDGREYGKRPVQFAITVFIQITGQQQKEENPQDLIAQNLEGIQGNIPE
jgi:hypothetical protein